MSYLPRTLPRTNLYCWLDATGLVNNTTNSYGICSGGTCSQWSDLSGNGRHFTQATGANQPTLGTGLSSRTALTFDGGDYLNHATASDWTFMHSTESTILIIVKAGNIANPNAYYGIMGNSGATSSSIGVALAYKDRAASSESDATSYEIYKGDSVASIGNTTFRNDTFAPNNYALLVVGSLPSSDPCFYVLTNDYGWGSTRRDTPSASAPTYAMQIGAAGNNVLPLVGGIQEIAIYNTSLHLGVLGKAMAYFQAKYSLL